MSNAPLITVGICPAWDITCRADGIDWGQHVKVSQTAVPADKAFNVSKALAWMGQKTLAAGLWGQNDWPAAQESLAALKPRIDFKLTLVPGQTRQNITVIDTHSQREMHLRAACPLATKATLAQLAEDLKKYINPNSCVAFSGSMPEGELLADCLSIIKTACQSGASVAVDSSGTALTKVVAQGGLYAIKPNLEELSQLLGTPVPNQTAAIIAAARSLCDSVKIVLVSAAPTAQSQSQRTRPLRAVQKTANTNPSTPSPAAIIYLRASWPNRIMI